MKPRVPSTDLPFWYRCLPKKYPMIAAYELLNMTENTVESPIPRLLIPAS